MTAERRRQGKAPPPATAAVPMIFVVPVWGEKYVRRWLEWSLPSLLSEGNLPAAKPEAFVIITRAVDAFPANDIDRLRAICPVEFIADETLSGAHDMVRAHRMGMEAATRIHKDPAVCFLNADMVVADGTYRTVRRLLDEGHRGVMTQGIPVRAGGFERNATPGPQGADFLLSRVSLDDLPQWKAPFPAHPSQLFFASEHGLLMHCWHLYPLAMRVGDIRGFSGTIDNDLAESCASFEQLAFIQDSKDGCFISLEDDPMSTWGEMSGEPSVERVVRWSYGCSAMHRRFFALPFRFGTVDETTQGNAAEIVDRIVNHAPRQKNSATPLKPFKALFITTQANEVDGHVAAWDSFNEIPSVRVAYDHNAICNDWLFTAAAEKHKPEIILYIGAHKAQGNPKPATLIELRKFAPLVNLVSDAADRPWHPVLAGYRAKGCFDLQVAIDGVIDDHVPVDLSTLTPVDTRHFDNGEWPERDIRFGFSGSVGRWNNRSEIVKALEWLGGLTVRKREVGEGNGYPSHVRFLKRTKILLNVSFTGTQLTHHVKGRVVEAGWAGCCLLEHKDSLIHRWFPGDCYVSYRDPAEAAEIARSLSDGEIASRAGRLSEEVRQRFSPRQIYGDILARVGLVPS